MTDNNNSLLKIFSECTKGKTKPINKRLHFFFPYDMNF